MSEDDNDVANVRQEIASAQQSGDVARANEAYARELELLAEGRPVEERQPQAETSIAADYFTTSGLLDSNGEAELLAVIGDDAELAKTIVHLGNVAGTAVRDMVASGRKMAAREVSAAQLDSFLDGYTDDEKRALRASVTNLPRALHVAGRFLQVAERHEIDIDALPDDAAFWRIMLPMCERIFVRLDRAHPRETSQADLTAAEQDSRDDYLDTMQAFEDRIAAYQARGLHRDANRVYQEQQAWLASRLTDNRIVGSGGRTA